MFNLRSLRFCLLALLMALVCIVAAPNIATVSIANTVLQPAQNSAERLEQQGRSHYEAGQFAEAVVPQKLVKDKRWYRLHFLKQQFQRSIH